MKSAPVDHNDQCLMRRRVCRPETTTTTMSKVELGVGSSACTSSAEMIKNVKPSV